MKLNSLFSLLLIFCSLHSNAQTYVGITADLGNSVEYSPDPGALLRSPVTPSGSVTVIIQEKIKELWYLQYGGFVGTLGYRINVQAEFDTLSAGNDTDFYSSYPNYNTIYSGANLAFGKQIYMGGSLPHLYFFLGGGFTYYFESYVSGSSTRNEDNLSEVVFEYDMGTKSDQITRFVELSAQTYLDHWLLLGLRYRHSFDPALTGSYNLYHVENPPSGSISLTQHALSIMLLLKI